MNNAAKITPNEILVPVFLSNRKGCWVAYSPVLKLYGYSEKSEQDSLEDFDKAINTFFHVQHTLGTLNKTLLSLGWTRNNKNVSAPGKVYSSEVSPFRHKNSQTQRQILLPA